MSRFQSYHCVILIFFAIIKKLNRFHVNMFLLQIEISRVYGQNEWRDDIRKMLMKAGIIGKPLVFLFADNQVRFRILLKSVYL